MRFETFALCFLVLGTAQADVPSQRPFQALFGGPATADLVRRAPLDEGRVYTVLRMNRRTRVVDEVTQVWRYAEQTYSQRLDRHTVAGLNVTGDIFFLAELGGTMGGDFTLIPAKINVGVMAGASYFSSDSGLSEEDIGDANWGSTFNNGFEYRGGLILRQNSEGGTQRNDGALYALVRHLKYEEEIDYADGREVTLGSGDRTDYGAALLVQGGGTHLPKQISFTIEVGSSQYVNSLTRETRQGPYVNLKVGVRVGKKFVSKPKPKPVTPTSHWR